MATKLPYELLERIAERFVTLSDHVTFSAVCAKFRSLYTESFWIKVFHQHGFSRPMARKHIPYGALARQLEAHATRCRICRETISASSGLGSKGRKDRAQTLPKGSFSESPGNLRLLPLIRPVTQRHTWLVPDPTQFYGLPRRSLTIDIISKEKTRLRPKQVPVLRYWGPPNADETWRFTSGENESYLRDHLPLASLLATTSTAHFLPVLIRYVSDGAPTTETYLDGFDGEHGITMLDLFQQGASLPYPKGYPLRRFKGMEVNMGRIEMLWDISDRLYGQLDLSAMLGKKHRDSAGFMKRGPRRF